MAQNTPARVADRTRTDQTCGSAGRETNEDMRSERAAVRKRAGRGQTGCKKTSPPSEVLTVKNQQGTWENIIWGMEDQVTCKLVGEAH